MNNLNFKELQTKTAEPGSEIIIYLLFNVYTYTVELQISVMTTMAFLLFPLSLTMD